MEASLRFQIMLLMLLPITGCMHPVPFLIKDYSINRPEQSAVGNPILRWGFGMRTTTIQFIDTAVVLHSYDQIKHPEGILKELVYKGVIDDKLYCMYREYELANFSLNGNLGAIAKPVYFFDVVYDLKQSRHINFQDFSIRIDSADQEWLRFTILSEPEEMDERPLRQQLLK